MTKFSPSTKVLYCIVLYSSTCDYKITDVRTDDDTGSVSYITDGYVFQSMSMLQRSPKTTADNLLQNLIKSVTLWEFVAMKADKIHPNSSRPRIETILMEFQALHKKVKEFGLEQLTPLTEEELNAKETFNDVLMVNKASPNMSNIVIFSSRLSYKIVLLAPASCGSISRPYLI